MTLLSPSPDRERPARQRATDAPGTARRTRQASAGQVLAVGLVCFSLWLALDARQLYRAASSSPLGTRRSVAMSVLRPIARAEEALSLDRLVNAANVVLSRSSAHGRPHTTTPTTTPTQVTTPTTTPTQVTTPTTPPGPPPLAQPTAAHPLTILEVGDSLGVDLGYGLADVIGTSSTVHLDADAIVDTGLANTAYYDWPEELEADLAADHPGIVVVMLGGNDNQNFLVGSTGVVFESAAWRAAYAARVAAMMHEATAAGAHVIWVGMPVMASPGLSADMAYLDAIYEQEAASIPGVTYLSTWKLLSGPGGAYEQYLTDRSGALVEVRDPDGVHLAGPAGDDLVADAVAGAIADDLGVSIAPGFPVPTPTTTSLSPQGVPIRSH